MLVRRNGRHCQIVCRRSTLVTVLNRAFRDHGCGRSNGPTGGETEAAHDQTMQTIDPPSITDHPFTVQATLADLDAVKVYDVHARDQRRGSFTFTTKDGRHCAGRFGSAYIEVHGQGMPERLTRVQCSPSAGWRSTKEFADSLRTEIGCLLRDLTAHQVWSKAHPDQARYTDRFTVSVDDAGIVHVELVVCDPLAPGSDIVVTGLGTVDGLERFSTAIAPLGQVVPEELAEFVDTALPLILKRRTGWATWLLFDFIGVAAVDTLRTPAYTGRWAPTEHSEPEGGRA